MKRVLITALAAAFAALATAGGAFPAGPAKVNGWFYGGLGFGTHDLTATASINVRYVKLLGILRATFVTEISSGFTGPSEDYYDVGLLFGVYPREYLSLAAGVARVEGERSYGLAGGRSVERVTAFGVPVEVQFTPRRGGVVGLGIVGYANINPEESFGGVTVGIEIGKLK